MHEPSTTTDLRATLDREAALLRAGIDLVASGGAPATTIAGLRLATAAIAIVRPAADAKGVVIEPLWGPDEGLTDVRIHRPTPEARGG